LKHRIGMAVDSLGDIDNALNALTEEEYGVMKENALRMGRQLGEGCFIKQALDEAFSTLK
ncbi:hypothetical protein, partial [Bacteroides heparinolyticus]